MNFDGLSAQRVALPELSGFNAFSKRFLVSAQDIEIENAHAMDIRFECFLKRHFVNSGIEPSTNLTTSLYLDTADLALFRNGLTLRDRKRGQESGGKRYDDQFGLKFRHDEFQKRADRITRRLFGDQDLCGITPYIRAEIERSHSHPRDSSELRFSDLPKDIGDKIIACFGQNAAEDMVFKPQILTTVERFKLRVFIDPFGPMDFKSIKPLAQISGDTPESRKFVCIEPSFDVCTYRRPPVRATISEILDAQRNGLRRFRNLGTRRVFEYEAKTGEAGTNLTDEDAIRAYIGFGLAIYAKGKCFAPNADEPIRPVRSKATIGFGQLTECKEGGRLHQAYINALARAP